MTASTRENDRLAMAVLGLFYSEVHKLRRKVPRPGRNLPPSGLDLPMPPVKKPRDELAKRPAERGGEGMDYLGELGELKFCELCGDPSNGDKYCSSTCASFDSRLSELTDRIVALEDRQSPIRRWSTRLFRRRR